MWQPFTGSGNICTRGGLLALAVLDRRTIPCHVPYLESSQSEAETISNSSPKKAKQQFLERKEHAEGRSMSWLTSLMTGTTGGGKTKEEEKSASLTNVQIVDIDNKKKKKHKKKAKADEAFNNFVWLGKEAPSLTPPTTAPTKPIYPSINGNHVFSAPSVDHKKSNLKPTPYDLLKRSSCKLNPKIHIPTSTVNDSSTHQHTNYRCRSLFLQACLIW